MKTKIMQNVQIPKRIYCNVINGFHRAKRVAKKKKKRKTQTHISTRFFFFVCSIFLLIYLALLIYDF